MNLPNFEEEKTGLEAFDAFYDVVISKAYFLNNSANYLALQIILANFAIENRKRHQSITTMEIKKTKEEALNFLKAAIQHKQEWKKELEAEFKGKDVNVVFL